MKVALLGIGTASPPEAVSQAAAAAWLARAGGADRSASRAIAALFRRSGVQRRRSVLVRRPERDGLELELFGAGDARSGGPGTAERMAVYAREAPPLALAAARRALAGGGVEASAIGSLVTVSCTGFGAPGVDLELIRGLDLRPGVERVHVGFMGCHGAINGLRVAGALARGEPAAPSLVCAVELCSLHLQVGGGAEASVPNALFADGAGALLLGPPPTSDHAPWQLVATGSHLFPDTEDDMTWRIGDRGFEMSLAPRVPEHIEAGLAPWLASWLAANGLDPGSIRTWAVHPGGPRILTAVERALDLPPHALDVSRAVLAEHGNLSSPTLVFLLERLRRAGAPLPCLALGFGPGLVAEVALFA